MKHLGLFTSEYMKLLSSIRAAGGVPCEENPDLWFPEDIADPTVRQDMEAYFNRLAPENAPYYRHMLEGPDDMPAHLKAVLVGSSLTLPVTNGQLNLGTWQGIYLCEHREHGGARRLVVTVWGEA